MRVWLDDKRPMPDGFDHWAKDFYEIWGLLVSGNVTHISFDHDLGNFRDEEDPINNGYEVAKAIESWAWLNSEGVERLELKPITWDIHSANPVGRKRIEMAMKNAEKYWNKIYKNLE